MKEEEEGVDESASGRRAGVVVDVATGGKMEVQIWGQQALEEARLVVCC